MQIELETFEKRLSQLEPREPSGFLKARIAVRMESLEMGVEVEPTRHRRTDGKFVLGTSFVALVSAIAAVWTVILVLDHRSGPSRTAGEAGALESEQEAANFEVATRPIEQYATLVGAVPSPVYYLKNGQAVQRVALRYLDTEVWKMEDGDGTFKVSSYRSEIRVIPAQSF